MNFDSVVCQIFTLGDSRTQTALLHIILCFTLHYLTFFFRIYPKKAYDIVFDLKFLFKT